jgi:hemoglobin
MIWIALSKRKKIHLKKKDSFTTIQTSTVARILGWGAFQADEWGRCAPFNIERPYEEEFRMKSRAISLVSGVLLLAMLAGPTGAFAKEKSLYDRLGGKKAITAVVDEFVSRVAADNRINAFFKATASDPARLAKFKGNLVDQICQASGGPCKYMGKDMKTAHAGMGITSADFDALVEDLSGALDKFKVDAKSKNDLLGALAPMKADIVEK